MNIHFISEWRSIFNVFTTFVLKHRISVTQRGSLSQGLRQNVHEKSLVAYFVRPVNYYAVMDTVWRMQ